MIKRLIIGFVFITLLFLAFFLVMLLWLARPLKKSAENINVLNPNHLIAHAGGGIDGHTYTNSKEALINALDNGFLYVELDLYKTTDGNVVCLHSLEDYQKMTSIDCEDLDTKSFLSQKLYGKYTPMTLNEAIKIWEERPFYFVTDKISDPKILNGYFKKNRDKVIVEAFSFDDYVQLERDGYIPMFSISGAEVRGLFVYIINSLKYGAFLSRIVVNSFTSRYVLRIYKNLGVKKVVIYFLNDDYKEHTEKDYVVNVIGVEVDCAYVDFLLPKK